MGVCNWCYIIKNAVVIRQISLLVSGEHMTEEELVGCFSTLVGLNPEGGRSETGTLECEGECSSAERDDLLNIKICIQF